MKSKEARNRGGDGEDRYREDRYREYRYRKDTEKEIKKVSVGPNSSIKMRGKVLTSTQTRAYPIIHTDQLCTVGRRS